MTATCEHNHPDPHDESYYDLPECNVHVDCDERCMALTRPLTFHEVRAALEHWRSHRYLAGCSHGH